MGRRKIDPKLKRSLSVNVRFRPGLKAAIEQAMVEAGASSLSEYVRMCVQMDVHLRTGIPKPEGTPDRPAFLPPPPAGGD